MKQCYIITKNGYRYSSSGVFDTESDALEWLQETHNGRDLMGLIDEGYRVVLAEFTTLGLMIDSAIVEVKEAYTNLNKAKEREEYLLRIKNTLNTENAVDRVVLIDAIENTPNRFWLLNIATDEKMWTAKDIEVIEYLWESAYTLEDLSDFRSQPLSKEQWRELWDGYARDENGSLLI